MENSPVQIVLNSDSFIEELKNRGGGYHKDFFEGSDIKFSKHRDYLQDQLKEIKTMQLVSSYAKVSYAKVILNQNALAKSHRPTSQLFKQDIAPIVGAGELGELFIELSPDSVDRITQKVAEVETETRYKVKKGKPIPNPSRLRSEIGAVKELSHYSYSDKRKFSVSEAIQWLSNEKTGGFYIVELFEAPKLRKDWDLLSKNKFELFNSFYNGLENIGKGLVVTQINTGFENSSIYGIKLEKSDKAPFIQFSSSISTSKKISNFNEIDFDKEKHSYLLEFLGRHPLVKKITLPPVVTKSLTKPSKKKYEKFEIPILNKDKLYPKLGVVDGGVSDVFGDWIEDRWNYISPTDKDESHGTFIAGLAVFGQTLNGGTICNELDGCKIVDIDLLPQENKYLNYYNEPLEFFTELETAVLDLKNRTGVRIFNFSLNIEEHVSTTGYSIPAQILDKIAEDNDIIFIISAGNTHERDIRKEWPQDNVEALKILANSRNDALKKPAESSRNLSVSALNPPNLDGIMPYALSRYSCRGPGVRSGLKPDFAHIGGSGTKHSKYGHGLLSINTKGEIIDGCGTSYAAPNVAKTLASLDHSIEGEVSRETLIGLGIHNAKIPEVLNNKELRNISKHLIGYGIPSGSNEVLSGDSSSITLVFANRVISGHKMCFNFSWPSSLVKNGKCTGKAKLTIVSTPKFDYKYGSEFVRVNIDAYLRQLQNDGRYVGRLNSIYTPEDGDGSFYEKDQIEHSFKWSPIKAYERTFPKGVGPTTEWRLDVEYLTRDGVVLPREGVPFTAILTISDPNKEEPVFNDMRQMLQSLGVQAVDIKTAARILPRV